METCKICHKFVKNAYLIVNTFTDEIKEAKGECKTHGLVDIEYDDAGDFEPSGKKWETLDNVI